MAAHSSAAYQRQWKARNPERLRVYRQRLDRTALRARWAVANALRSGKLVRPLACQGCGDRPGTDRLGRRRIEGHHHRGYDRPLDVEWLCRSCHIKAHRVAA